MAGPLLPDRLTIAVENYSGHILAAGKSVLNRREELYNTCSTHAREHPLLSIFLFTFCFFSSIPLGVFLLFALSSLFFTAVTLLFIEGTALCFGLGILLTILSSIFVFCIFFSVFVVCALVCTKSVWAILSNWIENNGGKKNETSVRFNLQKNESKGADEVSEVDTQLKKRPISSNNSSSAAKVECQIEE